MASKKKKKINKAANQSRAAVPPSRTRKKKERKKSLMYVAAGVVIVAGVFFIMSNSTEADNYDDLNLPSYAYNNPVTLKAYGYTLKNSVVVEKIPCYCGCGGMGHKSLKNCFISDDGAYSSHASNCDICVGEVIRIKNLFDSGMYISEIKRIIDDEYRRYGPDNGGVPITQDFNINTLNAISSVPSSRPVPEVDYSTLELDPGLRSLADGLNMTPRGVIWGQFVNMKLVDGTPLEEYGSARVQPPGFYGVPLVSMYSADYNQDSWIELHDIGYKDTGILPVNEQGMSNIVVTRPFIFGHTYNVQQTRQLIDGTSSMENSYVDYQVLLEDVDGDNTAIGMVGRPQTRYADIYYSGLNDAGNGLVQRELIYHLVAGGETLVSQYQERASGSLARGLMGYEVDNTGDILRVTIVGTLDNVLAEAL
ncbi:MAG: PCYCGC domain-containing protein [ANME-2 cluster archaeon]|nr:PCYCGC domain-containing protein [ANME-2 cluster archaeon]